MAKHNNEDRFFYDWNKGCPWHNKEECMGRADEAVAPCEPDKCPCWFWAKAAVYDNTGEDYGGR